MTGCQLRIYSIRPGLLVEFTEFWRSEIVPLRRRFGFEVEGAWSDSETSTFAWVVCHPDFAAGNAAYYASPDRAGLSRDPGEFIEHAELRLLEPVAPD
ncbi:MAG: NIPSNAP family containing protein [Solirubrobacteraceae bacterium]